MQSLKELQKYNNHISLIIGHKLENKSKLYHQKEINWHFNTICEIFGRFQEFCPIYLFVYPAHLFCWINCVAEKIRPVLIQICSYSQLLNKVWLPCCYNYTAEDNVLNEIKLHHIIIRSSTLEGKQLAWALKQHTKRLGLFELLPFFSSL